MAIWKNYTGYSTSLGHLCTFAERKGILLQQSSFDEKRKVEVLAYTETYSFTLRCNTMVYVT